MATSEITLESGERALFVDTEAEFARALDRNLPIVAPVEIAEAFGYPAHGDGQESGDDFAAEADDSRPKPEKPMAGVCALVLLLLLTGCGEPDLPSFWGGDHGRWVHDGVCNDPRFVGDPVAQPERMGASGSDASDCRRLFEQGRLHIRDLNGYFGDDAGDYARDGECDDPWFEGDGVDLILLAQDRGHDATDCRRLFEEGRIRFRN